MKFVKCTLLDTSKFHEIMIICKKLTKIVTQEKRFPWNFLLTPKISRSVIQIIHHHEYIVLIYIRACLPQANISTKKCMTGDPGKGRLLLISRTKLEIWAIKLKKKKRTISKDIYNWIIRLHYGWEEKATTI